MVLTIVLFGQAGVVALGALGLTLMVIGLLGG